MPAPVVTTISIILSSNKIWNGDILVTNSGPPETVTVKMERERQAEPWEIFNYSIYYYYYCPQHKAVGMIIIIITTTTTAIIILHFL